MSVSGSERPNQPPDDPRIPLRRTLVWALIGVAVIVGVILYFQYERVLAPLVSP